MLQMLVSSQHSNEALEYNGGLTRIRTNGQNVAKFGKQIEDIL